MAQQMLNLGGNLSPEQQIQQQQIARQQRMAELLMQQGQQTPSGQMVGNRYVAPSFFQYAAPLLQGYVGKKQLEKAEAEQLNLAKAIREQGAAEVADILNTFQGRQAVAGTPDIPTETYETVKGTPAQAAIPANPQLALAKATTAGPYGRALLPTILERAMPKPATPTSDIQNYQFMKESGQLPKGMTFLGYQTYLKELGKTTEKAPSGYRFMPDGSLEPIKGGPADAKSQAKFAGRENVDTLITGLRDQYNILKSNEGITSTEAGFIPNLRSAASRSAVGQAFGQAVGSTNQSARNTIAQSRPLLLNAIKDATGMSAKQMDSNAELKMYLAAATDPSLDYESNMNALKQLERLFGTPAENQGQGTSKTPTGQQKEVDFNSLPAKPKG
jgi:protein involved in polysaccharide export with SLBB domain